MTERRRRRLRLPRWLYWVAGAVIAFGGAIAARKMGEMTGYNYRVAIWLGGAVCIFAGLAIVSFGTRARLEDELLFAEENGAAGGDKAKRGGDDEAGCDREPPPPKPSPPSG